MSGVTGFGFETAGCEKTKSTEDVGLVLQDVWNSLKPRRIDADLK